MRNAYEAVLKFAAHDPLLAFGLACLALLIAPLTVMHLVRIFCGFVVVLAQEYRHEVAGLGRVFGRVKHELTSRTMDE
jgi:hypothetical protein